MAFLDIARTADNDLDLTSLVEGGQAVRQWVVARLETLVGDWYRNTQYGLNILYRKPISRSDAELELRALIRSIPGVAQIESLNLTIVQRSLSFTMRLLVESEGSELAVTATSVQQQSGYHAVQMRIEGTIG